MRLRGDEVARLQQALIEAFPSRDKLAQMVRIKLGEHLETIAGGRNLSAIVFNLIEWAESTGALDELIVGSHQCNPGNERLRAYVEEMDSKPSTWDTTAEQRAKTGQLKPARDMVPIPAGEFTMGADNVVVVLDQFHIDRYPVTNAEYKAFVEATNREPPSHWIAGFIPPELEDHPVVNVTWYDAQAYADWCGRKLPTNGQWEKAARGTDGLHFPWGNEFDPSKCNTSEGGLGTTTLVGTYPNGASPYGVLDMAGNVWEWTRGEEGQKRVVIRGGAWGLVSSYAKCFHTSTQNCSFSNDDLGFRCVVD